ncbi:MAG TPA: hypothetical protein VFU16_07180 [Solirubrobacterales bacterium]|nr:hypothetical protein [Solirubrobacterales bacterium]
MKRLVAVLLVVALFGVCSPARADYNPVGSGQTKIQLDQSFVRLLARDGVRLRAVAPARLRGRTVSFPAVGGKFDPVTGQGTVEHEGAIVFQAGNRKIPLKQLKLRTTQKHAPFSAKVGGSQLKIATVPGVRVSRAGFGDKVKTGDLALSAKLAVRLGKKLNRRDLFKPGLSIGRTTTTALPETVFLLERGAATLTFDPGFTAKLQSLNVAVNPIFPAEHVGPVFTLPIFGGKLAPDASAGRVETSGAIELLQLGGGQVFWKRPWLDVDSASLTAEADVQPSPPYAGKIGLVPVAAMSIGGVTADPARRTIGAASTSLALDPGTADTFNQVFAAPEGKGATFFGGEPVGTVSFTATAR